MSRAHLTGVSRLRACGLDYGPRLPVRFVIEGDLHLAFDNVFLHRTKKLLPSTRLASSYLLRSSVSAQGPALA